MATRKLLGIAAVVLCFAGGGLAGSIILPALAGTGSKAVSTAQPAVNPMAGPGPYRPGPDVGPSDRGPGGPDRRDGFRRGQGLVDFRTVADLLHVSVDELLSGLRSGSSIADIAAARGVNVQSVIDALVAKASESPDGILPPDLRAAVTAIVTGSHTPRTGFNS